MLNKLVRTAVLALLVLPHGLTSSLFAQETRPPAANPPRPPDTATETQGLVREPDIIQRAVIFGDRHFANGEMTEGWYVTSWNMIPGAGWLSLGPGYRRWSDNDRTFFDASAGVSWHGYATAQARFEMPRLAQGRVLVGGQVRLQDYAQVAYFGEGSDTDKSSRSEYRLQSANLVGYATFRPLRWFGIDANVGWLRPSIESRGGLFKGAAANTQSLFPADPVFAVPDAPAFIHAEASATADSRDFAGRPTRGGVYRAAVAQFSDRDAGVFSFTRYETEVAQFAPVADSRVVLALHGWLVGSSTDEGRVVPFYLQPALGGHNSLRGYADYRFHDRNMLVVNVEARVAMMTHVDAAAFMDAGNVASRVADLNLDKRSYGIGLRLHSRRQTFARLDLGRSREGWRVVVQLTDPLNLSRLTRRTAPVPFVH